MAVAVTLQPHTLSHANTSNSRLPSARGTTTRISLRSAGSALRSRSKRALRADARDGHGTDAVELAGERVTLAVQHLLVQRRVEHLQHEPPPDVRTLDVPALLHLEVQAPEGRSARRRLGGCDVGHLRRDPAVENRTATHPPV